MKHTQSESLNDPQPTVEEPEAPQLPDAADAPSISEKDGIIHVDFGTFGMP
jgi:hypothetical protein